MLPILNRSRAAGHLVTKLIIFVLGFFLFVFLACDRFSNPATGKSFTPSHDSHVAIPRIVHFVQLKQDERSELHFSFEAFLALYAAHHYIQPSLIFVHTDFSRDDIVYAEKYGSSWTRKVLTAFPHVVRLNQVTAPTETNGHEISRVEHKSDFVRLDQLLSHGGIYLDWDVLTLRPPTPLLNAGFRAVVGRQFDAFINNGIILASKDSWLVRIMKQETPKVFNGGWITHSVDLLTHVAERLASVPGEVLIMDFKAFSPFSWEQESVNSALERHVGDMPVVPSSVDHNVVKDPMRVWQSRRVGTNLKDKDSDWEYDFSDAYFLHKFFNDVENPRGFNGVSVPYILSRDSNYALAAYPIVMQGVKEGYIDENDDTL